jgi:hypothetical protein
MAAGAGGLVAVLVELLADRRRAADVGFDGGHVFRRRVGRSAEDTVEHIGSAHHRRGAGAVGGDFQHRALGEEAATAGTGGEVDFADLFALHPGDAVMLGEAFVEHAEVAMHDVPHAEVVLEQFLEKPLRLGHHGLLEVLLELGVELGVGLGEVDVAQVQPAAEKIPREAFRHRRTQETFGLGAEHGWIAQFFLCGEAGESIERGGLGIDDRLKRPMLLRIFEMLLDLRQRAWPGAGIRRARFDPRLQVGDLGIAELFLRRHFETAMPFHSLDEK